MTVDQPGRLYVPDAAPGSSSYWNRRWAEGPRCSGSEGEQAAAKAAWVTALCRGSGCTSVVDFGCGDGWVGSMIDVDSYVGVDFSEVAIRRALIRAPDRGWVLLPHDCDVAVEFSADVATSMDVVFHQVDDANYYAHLLRLLSSATRYVAVHSTDYDAEPVAHMRHRHVTATVEDFAETAYGGWTLVHGLDDPETAGWMLWERT